MRVRTASLPLRPARQRRHHRAAALGILLATLAVPAAAGYVTFGSGAGSKWDDRIHGTPAVVTWGFMLPGTTVDPAQSIASEVIGGSDVAALRGTYDASYGAGAFDAALQRAFDTWASVSGIQFVGPVADSGLPVGSVGAISPDIRVGAFAPVPASGFSFVAGVGYGPPGDDVNFPDPLAGDVLLNLAQPFIEPAGSEDDPILEIGNDLENLFLHELGHAAMGLGHPVSGPGDVMYIDAGCCALINRIPSVADVTGAQVVYGPPLCTDGVDNDGDGLVDGDDPACTEDPGADETAAALVCDNGVDDDNDGSTDWGGGDPGCKDARWAFEDPQCQDGINNDNAFGTDFDGGESVLGVGNGDPNGADPHCQAFWDNREAASSGGGTCGLGPEIAAALPLLWALRRRTRRVRGR